MPDEKALDVRHIARMEEAREARASVEFVQSCRSEDGSTEHAAEPIGGGWMIYGGKDRWLTEAVGLGMDGPVSDRELDALVGFFTSRGATPRVAVSSHTDPSVLAGLGARGFMAVDWEHVLARRIAHPDDDPWASWPWPRPQGVTLEGIDPRNDDAVRRYAEVATRGFLPPDTPRNDDMLAFSRRVLGQPRCAGLIARYHSKIVAVAGMEASEHSAALFGASVLPRFRRRGLHAALIIERIERARAHGSPLATVHTRPGETTERNALRLGFQIAYARLVLIQPGPAARR